MPQAFRNKPRISELQEEIRLLRSFIIGIIGKDEEGKYNPEFVRKIYKSSQQKPKYIFRDRHSFLKQIYKS